MSTTRRESPRAIARGVAHRIRTAYGNATREAIRQVRVPVESAVREFVAGRFPNLAERRYEGAEAGRRNENWRATSASSNVEIARDIVKLRNRASDLVRNDATAKRGLKVKALHIVGTGISPKSATGDSALDRYIDDQFELWQQHAGADGVTSWYAQQTVVIQSALERGEVLAVRVPRRYKEMPVPLQVEVLEGDHLDHTLTGEASYTIAAADLLPGHYLHQGVEFDAGGRRVAYHCWKDHPGESGMLALNRMARTRIKAADLCHVYKPTRPGQVRGVTELASVIMTLRQMSLYKDADLERKGTEALVCGVVTNAPAGRPGVGDVSTFTRDDGTTEAVSDLVSGGLLNIPLGTSVDFSHPTPTDPVGPLKGYLQAVASGLDITYEFLSSDLSNTNLSSIRYGSLPMRVDTWQWQWLVMIPLYCQRVWDWWVDAAIASGVLPPRPGGYPVKWSPPAWEEIDRLKEAMATVLEIRAGLRSYQDSVAGKGESWRETIDEMSQFIAYMDKKGISFDSDPRRPEGAAAVVARQEAIAPPPAPVAPAPDAPPPDVGRMLDVVQEASAGSITKSAAWTMLAVGFPQFSADEIDALLASVE